MALNSLHCLRNKLTFPLFFVLSASAFATFGEERTLVWKNYEEFIEGGWYAPNYKYPGVGHNKPSSFHSRFAHLDEDASEVWSGDKDASYFNFALNRTLIQYAGMTSFKISFKVASLSRKIDVLLGNGWVESRKVGTWNTWITTEPVEVHINSSVTRIGVHAQVDNGCVDGRCYIMIDEVSLTFTNPNLCNESCEYRAIDCHNYYSCKDFTYKEYLSCDKELGLGFNPKLGLCDRIENVDECNCKCEYRPDARNCSNFYFCSDSCNQDSCQIRSCPDDLLWTVDYFGNGTGIQQCITPDKAICYKFEGHQEE